MKKVYFIILFVFTSLFFSHGQMVMMVDDVRGNQLKTGLMKLQLAEKKISVASEILLRAMSGDMTRTFEEIVGQNEIIKNSLALRKTLGDAVLLSKAYKGFKNQIKATSNAIQRVNAKIGEVRDSGALDERTLIKANLALSRLINSLEEANDLFRAATDLSDEISRILRLEKIEKANQKIHEVERKGIPFLLASLDAVMYERLSRPEKLSYLLPPVSSSLSTNVGLKEVERRRVFKSNMSSLKELWESNMNKGRIAEVLKLVFGYGELLAGIIMLLSGWFIIRSRGTDKAYAVIRNISVILIGVVILKVISFNII